MPHKVITSSQNTLVKQLLSLKDKSRERKKSERFIIEGQRELQLALKGNYSIETLLYYPEYVSEAQLSELKLDKDKIIEISRPVFEKLAHRSSTEGIIAVAKSQRHDLNQLKFHHKNPLILVAEAPEKPGNIGALLRTADAANVDAVIIANPKTDLYNPNIIRSSVGCVFTNQIATGSTSEIISFLKNNGIHIFCAALQASEVYHKQDFTISSAIVVGTEAHGLTEEWLEASHQNVIIPMQGEIDSMNVSVAAGILVFEAKRQRNFN
ncbi:TrmH family RNA methyltransferase [Psychroserpens sp. XS_ASV72]|uniref:TrmH family RNA methyltransferase n=1 Tax=Psychroserpens sp. XS_ASV72 TaxID=3241293 RepID=UPI00351307F8